MGEQRDTTDTGARKDAAAIIAELWAEREENLSPRPSPAAIPQATAEPKEPRAGGKERALATFIVLLLVGAGLGIVAKDLGVIGAPSTATFAAEADAVCAPGNAGLSALSQPVGYQSLATSASTLVTTTDAQLGALRALDLPGGADRNRARGVLHAMAATGDAGRILQSAAAASDPAMTAAASRSMTLSTDDAVAKATAFGLTGCVTGMKPGIDVVVAGANGAVKTSFVEKATAMCTEISHSSETLPKIRNANDVSRLVNEGAALFDKLATGLKALTVPPGDEATVADITTRISNLASKIRELGNAALAGDVKRANAIDKEGNALAEELDQKFSAYGLTGCSQ